MRDDLYTELGKLERVETDRRVVLAEASATVEMTRLALVEAEENHRNARIAEIEALSMLNYVTTRVADVKQKIREVL